MIDKVKQQLSEYVQAFRAWLPGAPQHVRHLGEEIAADPRAVLQTMPVRIAMIVVGGLVLVLVVYGTGQWLAPPVDNPEPAEVVPFRVRCLNPECAWSKDPGTIMRDRDFNRWPTECPKCGKDKLYPWMRCHNSECGRWVVPKILEDGSKWCPRCGSKL